MLSYGDLKKGVTFILDGDPWQVLESGFLRMQQRKAVMQTKIRNLKNGKIVDRNFQASDSFEEAEIEREPATYIYNNRGEYWFHKRDDKANRMPLDAGTIGDKTIFLKTNLEVTLMKFKDKVINVELPVKVDYEVVEAPPVVKGGTAQGGSKSVKIETGATVTTPMFIGTGDRIVVNTETGEYVERMQPSAL